FGHHAAGSLEHGLKIKGDVSGDIQGTPPVVQRRYLKHVLKRGGKGGGKGAETVQQRLGQRLHVPLRDGAEQEKFQQLIIRQDIHAPFAGPFTQTLTVPAVLRHSRFSQGGKGG